MLLLRFPSRQLRILLECLQKKGFLTAVVNQILGGLANLIPLSGGYYTNRLPQSTLEVLVLQGFLDYVASFCRDGCSTLDRD